MVMSLLVAKSENELFQRKKSAGMISIISDLCITERETQIS